MRVSDAVCNNVTLSIVCNINSTILCGSTYICHIVKCIKIWMIINTVMIIWFHPYWPFILCCIINDLMVVFVWDYERDVCSYLIDSIYWKLICHLEWPGRAAGASKRSASEGKSSPAGGPSPHWCGLRKRTYSHKGWAGTVRVREYTTTNILQKKQPSF